jgi:putative methanogenesis marker 16 metalloprotein
MSQETKTIAQINEKLRLGQAVVLTAMEFKKEVRKGRKFKVSEVDVVTTGTRGVMSGTSATVVIPMAEAGVFKRAEQVWLNEVPCLPFSNPQEWSGLVDTVIFGTQESRDNSGRYGGGHLMRDIVEGKEIQVECLTSEGGRIFTSFTLAQLPFARIYSFRNDYQNYMAFINIKNHKSYRENPTSIFACRPVPKLRGLAMSGSGELNPMENDHGSLVVRPGGKILVNGVPGLVLGFGTRASSEMTCLSLCADMFGMDPQYMGGFKTSFGVEVTNGIAVPFPILNQKILDNLASCLDENIPLKIGDIGDRLALIKRRYSDVWTGAKLEIEFDPERCICCSFQCPAEYYCPMGAISWKDKTIDQTLCFACGACTANCLGGAFKGKEDEPRGRIGLVRAFDRDIPVIFRQSNRYRSELLAQQLKDLLVAGEFLLTDTDMSCKLWNQ